MLEAMAEWMGFPMYFALDGAPPPPRNGAGHATIYPYGPTTRPTAACSSACRTTANGRPSREIVLERPDLAADPRFKGNAGRADHREVIEPVIVGVFSALSTEEAIARLEKAGIGTARVSDMAALWAHPQLAARGRWREIGSPAGPLPALKPVSGDGWEPRLDPVPALGRAYRSHPRRVRPRRTPDRERQDMIPKPDRHQEMREALRALCAEFPAEYHRRHDQAATYPVEFIDALTRAGWLAAMIPEEYGGSGLGLTEATVVMEEINRSGGNAGHCHGQMYNMGTLLRHGSKAQKDLYLPKIASGELRLQSMARDRADDRHRHDEAEDDRRQEGRPLRRQRPEGLDQPRPAFRPDDPARPHHAACRGEEEIGRPVDLPRRPARGDRQGHDGQADPQHGQPRDQRALLRQSGNSGREPDRRGRQGFPLHPRRAQRRAHADRRRMHRRRLLVHRQGRRTTPRSASSSTGRSARTRACSSRSRAPM